MSQTILELLKNEHNEMKTLFKKAENCEERDRSEALMEIKEALIPHARGEEKTIYALLKGRMENAGANINELIVANAAYEEHRIADDLLERLEEMDVSDEKWASNLRSLKENVEHHINEEEQDLFAMVNDHFTKQELGSLRKIYLIAKDRYMDDLPPQSNIRERQPTSEARRI